MRISQKVGRRGSLMYVQRLVSQRPDLLERHLRDAGAILSGVHVEWVSPRKDDDWAEYRDASFLRRIGHPELVDALREFWPARGPQWDALGVAGDTVLLVEAKAHVGELASSCAARSGDSLERIASSLAVARKAFGAREDADWLAGYYQLANRLAHLWFLREHGIDARLVLLQFTGETRMPTSSAREAYDAAFAAAAAHLGFADRAMPSDVVHVHVDVDELPDPDPA